MIQIKINSIFQNILIGQLASCPCNKGCSIDSNCKFTDIWYVYHYRHIIAAWGWYKWMGII